MKDAFGQEPVTLSKKDIILIQETAFVAGQVTTPSQVAGLVTWIKQFVPFDYSACGHFSLSQQDIPGLAYSTYNQEFCNIYMNQGLHVDPAVIQLATTRTGQASSLDNPTIIEPKSVLGLKLDFGIRTCLSFAVRGVGSLSMYVAFSNFESRQSPRLQAVLNIVMPHVFLAYMRANTKNRFSIQPLSSLTPREHEIMKWVYEGKSNWEIAGIFHVSLNTIKFHMKNIMLKLGVENRWAAVAQWQEMTTRLLEVDNPQQSNGLIIPPRYPSSE